MTLKNAVVVVKLHDLLEILEHADVDGDVILEICRKGSVWKPDDDQIGEIDLDPSWDL